MKNKLLILFFTIATLFSCSNDDDNSSAVDSGTLKGKVTTVNSHKAVGGALVFAFDDKQKIHYTRTNALGEFSFNAPVGNIKLNIQTGDGSNFRTQLNVTVQKDQSQELQESDLRLEQIARIGYVNGSYDSIEDIVTDLGYEIEQISFQNLNDYAIVSQYDIIFLNCGSISISAGTQISTNLAKFVSNGGSLYASDWSVAYLVGGGTYTSGCDAPGGFIPDSTLCSVDSGNSEMLSAVISNTALSDATGITNLDIDYDLGGWQKIVTVDESYWDVLVRNAANNEALMIKTNNFIDPALVDSNVGSSANSDWVIICHTTENGTTITISIPIEDWPAHEANGDTLGACTSAGKNGTIYYTTFHNHANGNIGNSQFILEQVILNL